MGLTLVVLPGCASNDDSLMGTVLDPRNPAPPFELDDQLGRRVSLSDHGGQVVVLTFLYTYCPDVCPLVTSQLRETQRQLGDDAAQVSFLAVTVDPERDTAARAQEYSLKWDMADRWSFLVGERERLEQVWRSYYIDPAAVVPEDGQETDVHPETVAKQGSVAGLRRDAAAHYNVAHSAPVYLIDREGRLSVLFTSPLVPQDLVHDIRLLLGQGV
jgi:protein SCO1/2